MKKTKVTLTEEEKTQLIEKAKEGMNNAYCPVSDFPVGAAVLTEKGNIYQGCNTESVISGLGVCSERSAIDHAVAHGEYRYKAVAVVSKLEDPITPCGACLQYISEFSEISENDIVLIRVGSKGKKLESTVRKMLPTGFGPKTLGIDISRYRK